MISDGTVLVINNFNELEDAIDIYEDDCDDDDDYDYNDDDCNNCTPDQLKSVLIACSDWFIYELERNYQDLEDNYSGYLFNFFADNTITVSWDGNTADGTWSASGTGNNITVTFDIPGFEDINDTWNLYEIENDDDDETEVALEIGDDELTFVNNNCN